MSPGRDRVGVELANRSCGHHGHVDELGLQPVHAIPQGLIRERVQQEERERERERERESGRTRGNDREHGPFARATARCVGVCPEAAGPERGHDLQPSLRADPQTCALLRGNETLESPTESAT